jgi:hypothetical protein
VDMRPTDFLIGEVEQIIKHNDHFADVNKMVYLSVSWCGL